MKRKEAQRRQIVELRYAGATYDEIGRSLGISLQRAHAIFNAEQAAYISPMVESIRAQQGHRLELLIARAWRGAIQGNERDLKTLRWVFERQAKLYGTDAPTKHEVDLIDAFDREIAALADEVERASAGDAAAEASDPVRSETGAPVS